MAEDQDGEAAKDRRDRAGAEATRAAEIVKPHLLKAAEEAADAGIDPDVLALTVIDMKLYYLASPDHDSHYQVGWDRRKKSLLAYVKTALDHHRAELEQQQKEQQGESE